MLQFYYDCIDRLVDRRDFQYVEMDTDSEYMALSAPLDIFSSQEQRARFWNCTVCGFLDVPVSLTTRISLIACWQERLGSRMSDAGR